MTRRELDRLDDPDDAFTESEIGDMARDLEDFRAEQRRERAAVMNDPDEHTLDDARSEDPAVTDQARRSWTIEVCRTCDRLAQLLRDIATLPEVSP